jgi:hypothetical protein
VEAARRRKLAWTSNDKTIALPGDSPTTVGATLVVSNPISGELMTLPRKASRATGEEEVRERAELPSLACQ